MSGTTHAQTGTVSPRTTVPPYHVPAPPSLLRGDAGGTGTPQPLTRSGAAGTGSGRGPLIRRRRPASDPAAHAKRVAWGREWGARIHAATEALRREGAL